MIEHYSRDKILLRVLNTLSFVGLFAYVCYTLFSHSNYNIGKIFFNQTFFLSPFNYTYIIGIFAIIMQGIFIIIQLDSSSHGIKKRVIENYGFSLFLGNIFTIVWMYLFTTKSFKLSLISIFLATLGYDFLYIKANILKKYMYNDERAVFVNPFSVIMVVMNIFLIANLNIVINNICENFVVILTVISLIEIILIIAVSVLTLYFFEDKIVSSLNLVYLAMLIAERIIEDNFMPLGYVCFLAIIVIFVFMYKILKKKRKKKVDY